VNSLSLVNGYKSLWAVVGYYGENDYIIATYPDKDMAELHRDKAIEESKKNFASGIKYDFEDYPHNNYDSPYQLTACHASEFAIMEIPLYRHLDEFLEHKEELLSTLESK
jgi:hypothetical protein